MKSDFLGRGWQFPISPNGDGQIQMAADEDSIRQSIWLILSTSRGERVMRPDFGCALSDMVFSLNSDATVGLIETAVHEALVQWEPRINLLTITATPDPDQTTLLHIAITYQVRSTNSRYNLVYPFFLES